MTFSKCVRREIELIANWAPLQGRLTPMYCAEFMWMFRQHGVEHYKHIMTRLYLMLTGDGRCVVRRENGFEEADFETEWNRVTGRGTRTSTVGDGE